MKTIIETIPHKLHRYETVGDYWNADGINWVVVSEMGDEKMEFLVQLHEFIEQNLCRFAGISEQSITDFDVSFEAKRAPGNLDEPGFDPAAPYRRQHTIATGIETILCAELGVDFEEYGRRVDAL